jgi:hypothetical protein
MDSTKYIDNSKYIGMDVHKETVSIAVMNSAGKLVVESIIETKAATILQFIQGLRGSLQVRFEEGTWAARLYDLLKPHVTKIVVCDPRRNALLKEGNKSDKVDARKLVELLRAGLLRPVYHGENGLRTLKELANQTTEHHKPLFWRDIAAKLPPLFVSRTEHFPRALPLVSSVEGGIRAAHRRGECDRQDLGVPYSGPRSVQPMRMPSESHQGYALVPGETDVSLCQQCPN